MNCRWRFIRRGANMESWTLDSCLTGIAQFFSLAKRNASTCFIIVWVFSGDDPGLSNQKTPTILLLNPSQQFHSFGFSARDFYHDLDHNEARRWYYFDKFKMILHHYKDIGRNTKVKAANGKELPAMTVFSMTLNYFRNHALRELADATGSKVLEQDVRWVITVPAIWRQNAKQFMREAAYEVLNHFSI